MLAQSGLPGKALAADQPLEAALLNISTALPGLIIATALFAAPLGAAGIVSKSTVTSSGIQFVNLATDGPVIELVTPEDGGVYTSPIGINVAFAPKGGSTIDLSTLKVTVVSTTIAGVFELDITEDIKSYATVKGIKAPKAQIPAGDHIVTIQVADSERRLAERQLSITVREESVLERRARE